MRLLAPKSKQSYLFLAPPHSGLGKAVVAIYPGRAMQWDALASSPHPTDIKDIAPPPTTRLRSLWTASLSSGSDQRWIRGCGTGWLLAGPDSLPLWLCRVSMLYVLLCCWGVFPVLTLYSPRSIVWALFFFSSLSSCLYCIFLQFYLHFTTDYTLYDCVNIDFSLTGILCVCVCVCVCVGDVKEESRHLDQSTVRQERERLKMFLN